jgi:hypothetical protein
MIRFHIFAPEKIIIQISNQLMLRRELRLSGSGFNTKLDCWLEQSPARL